MQLKDYLKGFMDPIFYEMAEIHYNFGQYFKEKYQEDTIEDIVYSFSNISTQASLKAYIDAAQNYPDPGDDDYDFEQYVEMDAYIHDAAFSIAYDSRLELYKFLFTGKMMVLETTAIEGKLLGAFALGVGATDPKTYEQDYIDMVLEYHKDIVN